MVVFVLLLRIAILSVAGGDTNREAFEAQELATTLQRSFAPCETFFS